MIRNKILVFFVLLLAGHGIHAQTDLMVEGVSPNLHLTHTVAAKETWYSIGRTYNLSPKDIASYNRLTIDKPLEIGQHISVPLVPANFSQNDAKAQGEVFVPLYHIVQEKEWMYRISVNHNKVPVENLEKWNSITKDQAKAGMKLIVGYLKVKESNAVLATKGNAQPAAAPSNTDKQVPAKPDSPVQAAKKEPVKELPQEVKRAEPVAENKTVSAAAPKGGGYFKTQFDGNGKIASGLSGIFKSTSGWNDGKYYALMNNVTIGTIVKVDFPTTNKSIYAKVLGELPDMKESAGLSLRISDAAASELGVANNRFSVEVKY